MYIIVGLVRESYLVCVAASIAVSDSDGWRSVSATDSCLKIVNGGSANT